ncbi:MAG TPA: hypothetical protein VEC19_19235 [Usitatibacter sp.]|nr:hypothetical protein [Usitatibacter sp.]
MRIALAALLLLCLGTARSQPGKAAPQEVTGLDVVAYKTAVESGCRQQGRLLKHSWEQVGKRCKCVVEKLEAKLTDAQWRRATALAKEGKPQEEAKYLAPHMAAVKACDLPAKK